VTVFTDVMAGINGRSRTRKPVYFRANSLGCKRAGLGTREACRTKFASL